MYKFISNSQDKYFLGLITFFAILVSFAKIQYSQYEDMGIFLSEFALIAHGHLPYKEIFEIKDPLFLLEGGLVFKFFGLQGVYLQDTFLLSVSALLSYRISRKLQLIPLFAALGSIIFILTITGDYYQSLRSTLFALVLILVYINFFIEKNFLAAGFVVGLIGGFKMPYLFIAPALLPLLIFDRTNKKVINFSKLAIGFISSLIFIGLIMFKLNIVNDYINMVYENFSYAKNYSEIVGQNTGIKGHIINMVAYKSSFYLPVLFLIITSILTIIFLPKNKLVISLTLILISFLTLMLCAFMTMWPHHLHVLTYLVWPLSISILLLLQNIIFVKSRLNFKQCSVYFISIILLIYTCVYSGTSLPTKFNQSIRTTFSPKWFLPPEVPLLNNLSAVSHFNKTFARLGPNDDMGLAAFLTRDWVLSCSRYSQVGFESDLVIKETLNCIEKNPNFLVVSEDFFALNRPVGNFNKFREDALAIVKKEFNCNLLPSRGRTLICSRKRG